MRAGFRRLVLGEAGSQDGMPPDVTIAEDAGGRVIRPSGAVACRKGRVIWFHGGGYVFGGPDTHLRPAAWLASLSGRSVVLPRYRLAPEHRWPAPLRDALTAVEGRPDAVLAGDSAGGHLALVTALELARRGTPPAGLLLFSPNTDRTGLNRERGVMGTVDPMVDSADDHSLSELCFVGMPASHRHVSPILDDLSLLPPTHVEVGMPEVLYEDSRLLFERGRSAGASISLEATPGLPHMGQLWAPWWNESVESLRRAAAALRAWGEPRRQPITPQFADVSSWATD